MTETELTKLAGLSEALYLRRLQSVQSLLEEEAQLRRALMPLRNRQKQKADSTMRAVGADVSWDIWVGRTRIDLNRRLAEVLAQKLPLMESVRTAFGRHEALSQLASKEQRGRLSKRTKRQSEALLAAVLTRR